MKQIKKGKFSNYQFNRDFLSHNTESWRMSETSSPIHRGHVVDIKDLEGYRSKKTKINKLYAMKINQNLKTEETARQNYQKRVQLGYELVSYNKNPFSIKQYSEEQALAEITQKKAQIQKTKNNPHLPLCLKEEYIFETLNNMRENKGKKDNFNKTLRNQIDSVRSEFEPNRNAIKRSLSPSYKKLRIFVPNQQKQELPLVSAPITCRQKRYEDPFSDLERIAKIKQANIFQQRLNNKEINLFSVLHLKKGERFIKNGFETLNRYYFSFNGMLKISNSKHTIDVQDYISTASRRIILNQESVNHELPITGRNTIVMAEDIQKVRISDLMQVANGHVTPDILKNHIKNLRYFRHLLAREQEVVANVFNVGKNEVGVLMSNADYAKNQIKYLKELPFTKNEQRQAQIAELYKKKYEKLLTYQRICEEKGIYDDNLRRRFKQGKDKILKEQMRNCQGFTKKSKEKKRVMEKDKCERLESISARIMTATMKFHQQRSKKKKNKSQSKKKEEYLK